MLAQEEIVIPPVNQIQTRLNAFEMKVPVWGLTTFTVDGYIIAHRLFYEGMPENMEMAISSMSAGLISISEDFIQVVNINNLFKQVIVDARDPDGVLSFSILLKRVADNVLLACIFPSSTQLGLITFEIDNLSREIMEIVNEWDIKMHRDSVT
jgi:predicted regulator of Ras-like GTPase activity (Roadblock/LC7/MglB family)